MIMVRAFKCLLADRAGSAVVEFAIAGPAFIALLLGVFQAGVQVQNYNALRSIASDVVRHVVVEYQKDNRLSIEQIEARTASIAIGSPYLLKSTNLDIDVTAPASRVTGATEFNLTLGYALPNWLTIINVGKDRMTYSRPIFVPI